MHVFKTTLEWKGGEHMVSHCEGRPDLELSSPPAFGGEAGRWTPEDLLCSAVESCVILTTAANEILQPLHDRMPAIIGPEHYHLWLDPAGGDVAALRQLLTPYPALAMMSYPVGVAVNRPQYDQPDCINPLPQPAGPEQGLFDRETVEPPCVKPLSFIARSSQLSLLSRTVRQYRLWSE